MKRVFTSEEKNYIFRLWKSGKGFSEIGRIVDAKPGTVFSVLRDHGGIEPPPRRRSRHHLTLEEREEIRAGLSAKKSFRQIARELGRSPSTISREVNRNKGRRWYKAIYADSRAWRSARRPKPFVLAANPKLKRLVIRKLEQKWSPEQISGWLKVRMPRQQHMHVSHETIYKTLYIRSRKVLNTALMQHLRRAHRMRQSKKHSRSGDRGTINIVNGTSIHLRSRGVEYRRSIGHWEGDLVTGSNNTHIATLVDRRTRFTIILKVPGKDAESVHIALTHAFKKLPDCLKKSLTWDRGMELAKHATFTERTGVPVYFCDPQSPWQRGTNENTNGLLRQYFPKKTCLGQYTQSALSGVARQLNNRPRKTLNYVTPLEMMKRSVALTA